MAIEGKLTGWFELVEASRFGEKIDEIVAELEKLKELFPDCEIGDIGFTQPGEETFGTLIRFDLTWWEVSPPDFETIFESIVQVLAKDEYILLECKLRFGDRAKTLWNVLVTDVGVFSASGDVQVKLEEERKLAEAAINLPSVAETESEKYELRDADKKDEDAI